MVNLFFLKSAIVPNQVSIAEFGYSSWCCIAENEGISSLMKIKRGYKDVEDALKNLIIAEMATRCL
jgi:hypothetical protein